LATTKKKTKKMSKAAAKNAYMHDTVEAMILILLAILISISLVSDLIGVVGNIIKSGLLGLFGAGALLVPILLLYTAALLFLKSNKTTLRFSFGVVFTVLFAAFFTVCTYTAPEKADAAFLDYFGKVTAELWDTGYSIGSGGVIGGWLSLPLTLLCAKVGSGIIIAVLMLAAFILTTGITPSMFIRERAEYPEEKKKSSTDKAVKKDIKTMQKDIDSIKKFMESDFDDKNDKKKVKSKANTPEELDSILNEIESGYKPKKNSKKPEIPLKKSTSAAPAVKSDNTASLDAKEIGELEQQYGTKKTVENVDVQTAEPVNEAVAEPKPTEEPQPEEIKTETAEPEVVIVEPEKIQKEAEPVETPKTEEDTLKDASVEIAVQITPTKNLVHEDIEYPFPSLDLLTFVPDNNADLYKEELRANAGRLIETLSDFKIEAKVLDAKRGPTVTRYELEPGAGVRTNRIANLSDDIALHLAAPAVRIEAPIPGKSAIGIEVPNKTNSTVYLREIIGSEEFAKHKSKVAVALGKDISGQPIVIDIEKMPHLLIAGVTGSGKSVCINSILISLLYKAKPDEVKLILVDPKVVELNVYNGIPHLLIPVVTDPSKAAGALNWAVGEMLQRYKMFADKGVRNFSGYNNSLSEGEQKLPQIVIIIDELADLMMAAKGDIEDAICRLAQMARAAGMHLVIATQRPDSNVITGLIKANVPSHIAFAVSSQINSHIILDASGAEKLLGKGDMLYAPLGATKPARVQGCFVSDGEVEKVVAAVKQGHENVYDENIIKQIEQKALEQKNGGGEDEDDDYDPKLDEAIECVIEKGQASTSMLQRFVGLGYPRAAKIMDIMDKRGIIGPYQGSKPREVLITRAQWEEMKARR